MPVVSRRLAFVAAGLAVVVALGPWSPPWGIIAVNALLIALFVADVFLASNPASVELTREVPGIVALGSEATISWRIANRSGRRLKVSLADELAPSLHAARRRIAVEVPAGARKTATTSIRPVRRGRFTLSRVDIRVLGPLGLAGRQRAIRLDGVIRVFPTFRSRREAELRIEKARLLEVGLRSARGRGGGTEFDQLREFTEGDEFRHIDWSSTARTGRTIVRTYRAERNQSILLLLDSGRIMAGQVEGVPRLDHAMDAVMMLVTVATRLGDRAGLVAFDQSVRSVVSPGQSRHQLGRVTEAMYQLQPELVESDFRSALLTASSRFRRRHLMVVLTDLVEPVLARSLLPVLPTLAKDHLLIVAAVKDPVVEQWARSTPVHPAEAYRKAAAVAELAQRRRLAARLSRVGVTVVDEIPGRLAPALADVYLEIKAAGRL